MGGFDLAAEWMGWENLFHCEINEWCQKVLRFHFPKSIQYDDITRTDFTPWRGKVDILTGGFPCQPFSTAGKRRGAEDDRYLWPEMLRAIREIRPAWVIGENVAGITSMVQPGSEVTVESQASLFETSDKETLLEQEYVIETVCRDLEREGFPSSRFLFQLAVSEPRTGGTGYGLLPTVQTQGLKVCDKNGKTKFMNLSLLPTPTAQEGFNSGKGEIFVTRNNTIRIKNQNGTSSRLGLEGAVKHMLYPTPTAQDFKRRGPDSKQQGLPEAAYKGLLPTPKANSWKTPCEHGEGSPDLQTYIAKKIGETSQLNPLFVEDMMGYPLMWTTLPFLSQNGDKSQ